MHLRFMFLWICVVLIFFLPLSYGGQKSTVDLDENVITAADAGGGDLSSRDIVLIILGAIGVFFLIMFIYLLIFQIGMD